MALFNPVESAISQGQEEKQLATFVNHLALGQIETCRAMVRSTRFPANREAFLDILAATVLRRRRVISASSPPTNGRRTVVSSRFRMAVSSIAPSIENVALALVRDSDVCGHIDNLLESAKRRGEISGEQAQELLGLFDESPAVMITIAIHNLALAVEGTRSDPAAAQRASRTMEHLCDFILEHDGDVDSLLFHSFVAIFEFVRRQIDEEERSRRIRESSPESLRHLAESGDVDAARMQQQRMSHDELGDSSTEVPARGGGHQGGANSSSEFVPDARTSWVACEGALRGLWHAARRFASQSSYLTFFNATGDAALRELDELYNPLALHCATRAHLLTIFFPPPPGSSGGRTDSDCAALLKSDIFLLPSAKGDDAAHAAVVNYLLPHRPLHRFLDAFLEHFDRFDSGISSGACLKLPPPLTRPATAAAGHAAEWARYVRCLLAHTDNDFLSLISSLVVGYLTQPPKHHHHHHHNNGSGQRGASTSSPPQSKGSDVPPTASSFFGFVKSFLEHPAMDLLRPYICFELYGLRDTRRRFFSSAHEMSFDDHVLLIDFLTSTINSGSGVSRTPAADGGNSGDGKSCGPHPCGPFVDFLNFCVRLAGFVTRNGGVSLQRHGSGQQLLGSTSSSSGASAVANASECASSFGGMASSSGEAPMRFVDPTGEALYRLLDTDADVLPFVLAASGPVAAPTTGGGGGGGAIDSPKTSSKPQFGTPTTLSRHPSSAALNAGVGSPAARNAKVTFLQATIAQLVGAAKDLHLPLSVAAALTEQARFLRAVLLVQFVIDAFSSNDSAPTEATFATLADFAAAFAAAFQAAPDADFCDTVVNLTVTLFSTLVVLPSTAASTAASTSPLKSPTANGKDQALRAFGRLLATLLEQCQAVVSPLCVSSMRDAEFRTRQMLAMTVTMAAAPGAASARRVGAAVNVPAGPSTANVANPLSCSPLSFVLASVEEGDFERAEQALCNLFMVATSSTSGIKGRSSSALSAAHPVLVFSFVARRLAALRSGEIAAEDFAALVAPLAERDALATSDVYLNLPASDPSFLSVDAVTAPAGVQEAVQLLKVVAASCAPAGSPGSAAAPPTRLVLEKFLSVSLQPQVPLEAVQQIVAAIDRARRICKSTQTTVDEIDRVLDSLRNQARVWVDDSASDRAAPLNHVLVAVDFLKQLGGFLTTLGVATAGGSDATSRVAFLMNDAASTLFDCVSRGAIDLRSLARQTASGAAQADVHLLVRIVFDQYVTTCALVGQGDGVTTFTGEHEANVLRFLAEYIGAAAAVFMMFAVSPNPLQVPFEAPHSCVWLMDCLRRRALVVYAVAECCPGLLPGGASSQRIAALLDPLRLERLVADVLRDSRGGRDLRVSTQRHLLLRALATRLVPAARSLSIGRSGDGSGELIADAVECLLRLPPADSESELIAGTPSALVQLLDAEGASRDTAVAAAAALLMEIQPWPHRAGFLLRGVPGLERADERFVLASVTMPYAQRRLLLNSLLGADSDVFSSELERAQMRRKVVVAVAQIDKLEQLTALLRSSAPGSTATLPPALLADPLPFLSWRPEAVAAIAEDLASKGLRDAAIGFLTILLRDSVQADETVAQALVHLHTQRLLELVSPVLQRKQAQLPSPTPPSRKKPRDVGLRVVQSIHDVLIDEFGAVGDSGEPVVELARAAGFEGSTITVQLVEAFIDAMSAAAAEPTQSQQQQQQPSESVALPSQQADASVRVSPWGLVARVLRYCHSSPLIAPLFEPEARWKQALVGVEALIALERVIALRNDDALRPLLDGAFLCHPQLLIENLIASQRVIEAAKVISDVEQLQSDKALRRVIAAYAKAACDVSSYDMFDDDEFPNGKTKGASLDRALKRDPPLSPPPVRIAVHPSMQAAELRRVRGTHRYENAPNIPLCTLLLNLCGDAEFAQDEAYTIAAEMFESLGEYDSDVTKAVVIDIAEHVVRSVNPGGEREVGLLKKFQISRHLVVCGWKEHPQHADLDSHDGVMRLIGQLLAASQAKAAFSIADACGMDIGAVESLWVDRAIQLLQLGLFDEAFEAASHLKFERVQREVFDVVIKTPVTFGYTAVNSGGHLSVKKIAPEVGRETLGARQLGFQNLIERSGDVQDLLGFHVRCGAMDNVVTILMQRGTNLGEDVFVNQVLIPCHKMRADGLLRDALMRYDPTLVSVRPLLMQVGKHLEGARQYADLLAWQQWMCDYARAAHTATMLALEEKALPRKLQLLQLAEKNYLEAKFQPLQRKGAPAATTNTSDSGVVLPPTRLDGERLQNALIQCRLQMDLCNLLNAEKQDVGKYTLYGDMDDVARVAVELLCGSKNACALALQIVTAFRLPIVGTTGAACRRLLLSKKSDAAEAVVEHVKRSLSISIDDKNAVMLDVIRTCVAEQKQVSKALKWAEQLLGQMTSDGGHRCRAMLALGKYVDAQNEASQMHDTKLMNEVFRSASDAVPQTAATRQVVDAAQQFLARYDMR